VGIAVFAFSYRATLTQGEREQARFAVPAPYLLQEDLGRLVTIQQAHLPVGYRATPILRDTGSVSGNGGRDFTLLALPANVLPAIDGWRSDFSGQSPKQLAALLRPSTPQRLVGIPLHGRTFRLPFTTTGDRVGLHAVIENRRGDFTPIDLGEHEAGTYAPTVVLPPESRGGRLVALRLSFPVIASYVPRP